MALSPDPASAGTLQELAGAVLHAHAAGNAALEEGERTAPRYRVPGLPADLARPPTEYRLACLELTVRGYAVRGAAGWTGHRALLFSLRRPPFWRRLRHGATPIACTLRADAHGVVIAYAPVHAACAREQAPARIPLAQRARAWLSGWRARRRGTASETVI